MTFLKIIYTANIIITGWISISCLFFPKTAQTTVFSDAFEYSESIRLVGALWGAILVLSFLGLFFPKPMSLVLVFQVIYKFLWLLIAVLPALAQGRPYPKAMAVFFIAWVIILPFAIPWKYLFAG